MFAAWESEIHRPGLIANGYIGSTPNHPALKAIVEKTSRMSQPLAKRVWSKPYWDGRLHFRYKTLPIWETLGSVFFTKNILPFSPSSVTILPSVLFMPQHFLDIEARKSSLIYAHQVWGTTTKSYSDSYQYSSID